MMTLPKQQQQVELKSGEVYRGTLVEAEDNWNCQLTNVSLTGRDGALFFFAKEIDVMVVVVVVVVALYVRTSSRMILFFLLLLLLLLLLSLSSLTL